MSLSRAVKLVLLASRRSLAHTASFVFTDSGSSGSDANTYSDTLSIGSGDGSRTIIIAFAGRAANGTATAVSALTIDGAAAAVVSDGGINAFVSQVDVAGGPRNMAGIYRISASDLPDPNATSVSLSLTWNGTALRCAWAIGVTADAIDATADDVTTDSALKNGVATSETLDVGVNTSASGFIVGVCFAADSGAASASNAWTGATEAYDFQVGGETAIFGAAAASAVAAEAPRSVSVQMTNGSSQFAPVAVCASFAPAA
jgi:hypothetical protein